MSKQTLFGACGAILIRLPFGFLFPFAIFFFGWTLYVFKYVTGYLNLHAKIPPLFDGIPVIENLDEVLIASVHVIIYLLGFFLAYNLAVIVNWMLVWAGLKTAQFETHSLPAIPHRPAPGTGLRNDLAHFHKIGIVLAGGGAKGAFQAGAMKAIYQYLLDNNALDKVKVIAGTSIGSWNALFWLTDLIVSPDKKQPGAHEQWWRSISLRSLVSPSWYFPCVRNAFFVTEPWQKTFDEYFGKPELKKKLAETNIHYYFTSSHVSFGHVTCVTNNPDCVPNNPNTHRIRKIEFHSIDKSDDPDQILKEIKFGVFASMDLPPLFPYMQKNGHYYEDGGVIDNLPLFFAGMEDCDLVFVLPLNSDMIATPNRRSVLGRFLRVMDIRQGALERASFKNLYLYNELAALRDHAQELEKKLTDANLKLPDAESVTLKRARDRTHIVSKVFAICPHRTVVEETINTQELWKKDKARVAFDLMEKATKDALAIFRNHVDNEIIQLWLAEKDSSLTSKHDIF